MPVKKITKKSVVKKQTTEPVVVLPVVDMDEVIKLLEKQSLNKEQHMEILSLCLQDIGYFPIEDILTKSPEGNVMFKGEVLSMEQLVQFRSHLHSLKDNIAFRFFSEQISFDAITHGIHHGDTTERIMFSKSALYILKKFKEHIINFDNQ